MSYESNILLVAALLILSSCSFFRVIPESPYTAQSIMQYEDDGKYLILHTEKDALHIYNLDVKDDSIHAILYFQLGYHAKYLDAKEKGLNKFRRKREPQVIESVHIYSDYNEIRASDPFIIIPLSSIYAVKSYEYARAPSRASVYLPIVLPIVGLAAIVLITIADAGGHF